MSEDGFSDSSDEPNMEIQIETLMGSSFDLRVSAMDTVQDIKRRIHRVEGIPITHQNLIFQSKELQDARRLVDVGIKDGSKLKLVLSMRGGPISTRRISTACDHQLMLKELKELLDTTRDEIGDRLTPGSKVSVLVFKEGDIINLLRVIENEDGSYMPYSEKPISPPSRISVNRVENRTALFEKLVEDNKMMSNITTLRKKMEDATARKRKANKNKIDLEDGESAESISRFLGESCGIQIPDLSFKLLGNYKSDFLDHLDLKIFEQKASKKEDEKEEGNQSESEEIALKDKHRSKQIRSPRSRIASASSRSLYSESKGAHSHTKHIYARMHKKSRDGKSAEPDDNSSTDEVLGSPILSPLCLKGAGAETSVAEVDKTVAPTAVVEEMTMAGPNRLHVARLVISDNPERPKSTTESIEVEDNSPDLWSLHDSQPRQRLKSATYKLGVLKRRQSLNYGIDEPSPKVPQDVGEFNYGKSSSYEVCSSSNFYHMPPFMAAPSAIPPQYAPKNQEICDYYYRNRPRSPLYGRTSSKDGVGSASERSHSRNTEDLNRYPKLPDIKSEKPNALFGEYSDIQRLKNDRLETSSSDLLFTENEDTIDELCSYYNLGSASEFLNEAKLLDLDKATTELEEKIELPPVIKKRARCNFCNRKLNITNIYNCRCGKIFCSQHRYSEVHHCNYDYKTDGRRFLEQQNPLVTADKINRF